MLRFLLNRYAANYIEGIENKDLTFSLTGHVEIKNLTIKPSALD